MYSYEIYLNGNAVDIRWAGVSVGYYQGDEAVILADALNEAEDNGTVDQVCRDRDHIIADWYNSFFGGE